MQFAIIPAVFFTTILTMDLPELNIKIPKRDDSYLIETMIGVLTSCYGNQAGTVGLAGSGHSAEVLFRTLSSRSNFGCILIDNTTKTFNATYLFRGWSYKLKIFVVAASSPTELMKIIKQIKISVWWNHMASFFIFDREFNKEYGCSKAFELLWTAWEMNLLNAKFLCEHSTNKSFIYSYNPYTPSAPEPWQREHTYTSKSSHPWTLFVREYPVCDGICDKLDFEKTVNLGGYKIRSSAKDFPKVWDTDNTKTGLNRFGGVNGIWAQMIFYALKANISLKLYSQALPGLSDGKGNDIAIDTVNGVSDLLLMTRYLATVQNFTTSKICYDSGLSVATQYSEDKSQLSKFIGVLDISSRLCVLMIVTMTMIFFKFFQRQSFVTAILNILRISCNSNLPKLPKTVAPRIYLTGVFLLAVTILAIYQGKFASLVTKPIGLPNVDTMDDLAEHSHTVHGHHSYARFFDDSAFKGRFVKHNEYDCVKHVVRDSSVACVMDRSVLISKALELKLYVSRKRLVKLYTAYVIRKDWPLEERFNIILGKLVESGLLRYTNKKHLERALTIRRFYDGLEKKQHFENMTLHQLAFAFVILGVGLVFASTAFIVEITIDRMILAQLMASRSSKIVVNLYERLLKKITIKVERPT